MSSKLDKLLPAIIDAGNAGLTVGSIRTKFVGKSRGKGRDEAAKLQERLASLVHEGAIWGPLKYRRSQYYFAAGCGPSIETASDVVVRLVLQSGLKLLSKASLDKRVTGMNHLFFADGIKHAVATRAIAEFSRGTSKYYLHRDLAAEVFGFTASTDRSIESPTVDVAFEDLLPVYRRLKSEQGGFSAVKISDLMNALNVRKEVLHRMLLQEAKSGRVTLHHTTSVELPPEVIAAGIRLPGFAEPFVTVIVKNNQ